MGIGKFFAIILSVIILNAIVSLYVNVYYTNKKIDATLKYIDAAIYKKDAQLYLMNTFYNDEVMHKMLADSFKVDCINYKNKQ